MGKKDPRVDAYIAKAAPFARPILKRLRKLVQQGCPAVVEEIKWGMPHFNYKGMFCGMAAFKAHCTFGFWNRALEIEANREAMGQFGCVTAVSDLPSESTILAYVREARRLADVGLKLGPVRRAKRPLPVPPALTAALKKTAGATAKFRAFFPEPAARIFGMDHRGQDRPDPRQAPRDRLGLDRRGQDPQLEVSAQPQFSPCTAGRTTLAFTP